MSSERLIPLLLRTAHTLRRRQEETGDRHGITLQQFNVLSILAGAENRGEDALPVMEICRRLVEPGAGITRFVKQLAGMGLIQTIVNPKDGRQQLCQLTKAGRQKLKELSGPISRVEQELMRGISEELEESLRSGLKQLMDNLKK